MPAQETTQTTRKRSFELSKAELFGSLKSVLGTTIPESTKDFVIVQRGEKVVASWTERELVEPEKKEPSTAANQKSPKENSPQANPDATKK